MGFKNKTLAFRVVQVGSEGWEREQALLPKLADLDKQPANRITVKSGHALDAPD